MAAHGVWLPQRFCRQMLLAPSDGFEPLWEISWPHRMGPFPDWPFGARPWVCPRASSRSRHSCAAEARLRQEVWIPDFASRFKTLGCSRPPPAPRELEHRRFPFRTAAARLRGCDGPAFPPPRCAVRGSARPAVLKAGLLPRLLPARCPAHDPPGPAKASLRLREPSAAHLSPILVRFMYSVSLLRSACMFTALVSS